MSSSGCLRLDQAMVTWGLAPSRSKAQELISSGQVFWGGELVQKASLKVSESERDLLSLKDQSLLRYVSRGGLKLQGALENLNLVLAGMQVLDLGQSTGGFTDCCLQQGASKVVGVDVGHGQLHEQLRGHPDVIAFEGVNVKDLTQCSLLAGFDSSFDLIVSDLSFISLKKIDPGLAFFLKPRGAILFLVKPQFELSKADLNSKGVVKETQLYPRVQSEIESHFNALGFRVLEYIESSPKGQDGNQEFFIYAQNQN